MTLTITERGWRCLNLGCPTRDPVRAAEPPKCYTCERPMAEVHYPVTEKEIGRLAEAIEARHVVTDLGSNPTAEQLRVAGFDPSGAEYVMSLAAFRSPPDDHPDPGIEAWLPGPLAVWRAARDSRVRHDGASYDDKQRPLRTTSVGIDDRGQLSVAMVCGTQVHQEVERQLRAGVRDPVSVGYDVQVEPAYRCTRAGCPAREPVRASSPPTCYTCQQPMSAVAEFVRPALDPGIAAEIEFFKRRLAGACDMPLTLLLGETAARYDRLAAHGIRPGERDPRVSR